MDSSLRFRSRYPLYAMYSRLIFQLSIDVIARYRSDDFLVPAGRPKSQIQHRQLPTLDFAEPLIHSEQISRKDRCFVSAGTTPDLEDAIFRIVGVFRDQQLFYLFFKYLFPLSQLLELCLSHLSELRILLLVKDLLGAVNILQNELVLVKGGDNLLEIGRASCRER